MLSEAEIETFVRDGCVKIRDAFSSETAAACRETLWRDMKLSPDSPADWKEPVVRLGMYADPPFVEAASSLRLREALDQLVGVDAWIPPIALGAMVVRFPVGKPWDDGWHIDASFPPPDDPASFDYFKWRVNFESRGRAMLMLFLLSDCGQDDAPTRVRVGSHLPMARQLERYGADGVSLTDLAKQGFESSAHCDVVFATGDAGTVWLLHPLSVHAAQGHNGREPRFLAQPGLVPRAPLPSERGDSNYSPVERAIRLALG